MTGNEWMYGGRTSVTDTTLEWGVKTDYFVMEYNRGAKSVCRNCPCAVCQLRHRRGKIEMTKHLWLFMVIYFNMLI